MASEGTSLESLFGGDLRLEADLTGPPLSETRTPGDTSKSQKIAEQLCCEGHSRGLLGGVSVGH